MATSTQHRVLHAGSIGPVKFLGPRALYTETLRCGGTVELSEKKIAGLHRQPWQAHMSSFVAGSWPRFPHGHHVGVGQHGPLWLSLLPLCGLVQPATGDCD